MDKMAKQGGDAPKLKRQYPEKEQINEYGMKAQKRQRYSMNYKSYESATVDPHEQNTRMLEYMFPGYKVRANVDYQEQYSQTKLSYREKLSHNEAKQINADFEVADIIEPVEKKKLVELSQYELSKKRRGSLAPHGWVGPPLHVRMRVSDFLFIEITPVSLPPVLLCLNKGVIDHHTLEVRPQFVPQVTVLISGMEIYPEDKYKIMNVNRVLAKRPSIYLDTNRDVKVRSGGEWKTRDDKEDRNIELRKIYRFNESEMLKNIKQTGPTRKQVEPPSSWVDLTSNLKPIEYRLNQYEDVEKIEYCEPINTHFEKEFEPFYRANSPKQMHKKESDPILFSKHFLRNPPTHDLVSSRLQECDDEGTGYLHMALPQTHLEMDDDYEDYDGSRKEKHPIKYHSVMDLQKPVVDKEVFQDPKIRGRRGTFFVSRGYTSPGHIMESIDFASNNKTVEIGGAEARSMSRKPDSSLDSNDKRIFHETRTKRGTMMPKHIPEESPERARFRSKPEIVERSMDVSDASENSEQMRAMLRQTRTKRGTIMPKYVPEDEESPEPEVKRGKSRESIKSKTSQNYSSFQMRTLVRKNKPKQERARFISTAEEVPNLTYEPESGSSLTSEEKRQIILSRGPRGTVMPKHVPDDESPERPRFMSKPDYLEPTQDRSETSEEMKNLVRKTRTKRGTIMPKKRVSEDSESPKERTRFKSKADEVPHVDYEASNDFSLSSEEKRKIIQSRGPRGTVMPKKRVSEDSESPVERTRFKSKADEVPHVEYEVSNDYSLSSEEKRKIIQSRGPRGTVMPKKLLSEDSESPVERTRFKSKADEVPHVEYEASNDFSLSSEEKRKIIQSRGPRGTVMPKKRVSEDSESPVERTRFKSKAEEVPHVDYEASNDFSLSSEEKRKLIQSRGPRGTVMPKKRVSKDSESPKERTRFKSNADEVPHVDYEASNDFSMSSEEKRKLIQSRGPRGTVMPKKHVSEDSESPVERTRFKSKADEVPNVKYEPESTDFSISSEEKRKIIQSRGPRGTVMPKRGVADESIDTVDSHLLGRHSSDERAPEKPDIKNVSVQSDFKNESPKSSEAYTSDETSSTRLARDNPLFRKSYQREKTYMSMSDIKTKKPEGPEKDDDKDKPETIVKSIEVIDDSQNKMDMKIETNIETEEKRSKSSLRSILSNTSNKSNKSLKKGSSIMSNRSLSDAMNTELFKKPPSPFEIYKEQGIHLSQTSLTSKMSIVSLHPLLEHTPEEIQRTESFKSELRTVLESSLPNAQYDTNDKAKLERINRYLHARGASPVSPSPDPDAIANNIRLMDHIEKDLKELHEFIDSSETELEDRKEKLKAKKSFSSGHNFAMYKGDKALEDEISSNPILNILNFSSSEYEDCTDDEKVKKRKHKKVRSSQKLATIQEEPEIDKKPKKSLYDLMLNVRNEFNPIRDEIDLLKQKMFKIQKDMPDVANKVDKSKPPRVEERKKSVKNLYSKLAKKLKSSSNPSI